MFGKGKKISVPSTLYSKLEKVSAVQGCTSVDEYVERILENEAERVLASQEGAEISAAEVESIASKLKGLGYLE